MHISTALNPCVYICIHICLNQHIFTMFTINLHSPECLNVQFLCIGQFNPFHVMYEISVSNAGHFWLILVFKDVHEKILVCSQKTQLAMSGFFIYEDYM
jgi:hypothetical protein